MIRYAITDRTYLIGKAGHWAQDGVDYVQLRDKTLEAGALVTLAKTILHDIAAVGGATRLLVNSRADVALAAGAHGVHLTSYPDELTAPQVRRLFVQAGKPLPVVSASCHNLAEGNRAAAASVDLVLFAPVFEKRVNGEVVLPGVGLEALHQTCSLLKHIPVLAMGGITWRNAETCIAAGAAGVAGIRLFM